MYIPFISYILILSLVFTYILILSLACLGPALFSLFEISLSLLLILVFYNNYSQLPLCETFSYVNFPTAEFTLRSSSPSGPTFWIKIGIYWNHPTPPESFLVVTWIKVQSVWQVFHTWGFYPSPKSMQFIHLLFFVVTVFCWFLLYNCLNSCFNCCTVPELLQDSRLQDSELLQDPQNV